jgi:hypothetical protein
MSIMSAPHDESPAHPHIASQRGSKWSNRLALLAVSILVSFNLFIWGPFEIFTSNRSEFDAAFADLLWILIRSGMVIAAVLFVVGLLIPNRIRHVYGAVLLTLGVLLWIQGSFVRWGYGEFDGSAIDWKTFSWQGRIDIAIWLIALIFAVRFSKWISRHTLYFALAFIIVQSGFLAARSLASSDDIGTSRIKQAAGGSINKIPQALCQLSSSQNVFHIILDGFQTDVFLQLVDEEDLSSSFDGFVVYRDNVATGKRTVLTVPSTFSSLIYDGTETESEYFRRAMDVSFQSLLKQNGYVINLMPYISMRGTEYTHYYKSPSTYQRSHGMRLRREAAYLIDAGMFRQFPQFMKRFVYNDQNWRLSSMIGEPPNRLSFHQKAFFRDYIDKLTVTHSTPAYHFLHLLPPHGPFVTSADGSYAGKVLPNTREHYKNEARYILLLFMEFIDKLKQLGLYDSSIILLHGDHGMGMEPKIDEIKTTKRMGQVAALLLLKQASAHGPLHSSWAQTSLADIPATLMNELSISHSFPGESIVEMDPSHSRERHIVFVTDRSSAEPTVQQWVISGSVYDSTSWHPMAPRKMERRIHPYEWGTRVRFGISGNGDGYLTSGWTKTSPTLNWNKGDSAVLTFGIKEPPRDVMMTIVFVPFLVPGKLDRQRINIAINGRPSVNIVYDDVEEKHISTVIPRELLKDDRLELLFEFPDAISPKELGISHDSRKLCMGLYRFEANLVSYNDPLDE